MRWNLFILILTFWGFGWVNITAQSGKKIPVSSQVETVETLIAHIEKNSDYIFFYNIDLPDLQVEIRLPKGTYTIEQLLRLMTGGRNVGYSIVGRQIVLYKRPAVEQNGQNERRQLIYGTITDTKGDPVIGANIVEKYSTNGTISDQEGNFRLSVHSPTVLQISYIGFTTQEVPVKDNKPYMIRLQEDAYVLNELVVVGYGTLQKKQVTSSITSLTGNDLLRGTASSTVAASLIGKITGLVLHETSSPNAGVTLQLRGTGSINADKEPLIVVDGMPGADIRSILPEDIETIDVLKDASAGAIYGSRATNGVLLITTRTSNITNGKVRFNYTGEGVFKQPTNKPRMLTAEEYVAYGRGNDYGSRVDWWNETMNDQKWSQRHVFSAQTGVPRSQLYVSMSYENMKGLKKFEESTRYSGRINANFKFLDDWLEIKTHVDYRQNQRTGYQDKEYPLFNPDLGQVLSNNPTRSPYDPMSPTGYNIWLNEPLDFNMIAYAATSSSEGLDKWFKPDLTVKLNIRSLPGLSLQQTVAYENRQWELHQWRSRYNQSQMQFGYTGWVRLLFDKAEFITSEGYATYLHTFGDHKLNAVAGYSYWERNHESFEMQNRNFTNDGMKYWNIGDGKDLKTGEASMNSFKAITEKLLAYFARVNYDYQDKYMLMATYRREGSSKFTAENYWGDFWSVSTGWRVSREPFAQDYDWLCDLKLRVGYGVVGNNGFDSDYAATLYGADNLWQLSDGSWANTYGKTRNVNRSLRWEKQGEWNVGIDYSLFNERLYGKFDLYNRRSHGLIFEVEVPQPPNVHQRIYKNVGVLVKKGWEFELGYHAVRTKDWQYTTNLGISHLSQKVNTLWGDQSYIDEANFPSPGAPGSAIRIQEGVKLGEFHLWKFAGFDEKGNWLLYNKNGEVIPAIEKKNEDKQHIGNYYPALTLNWNHTLRYKNFDLNMTLLSYIDFDIYNAIDMYYGIASVGNLNVLKKAYTDYAHIKGEKELCDFFLQDGTFLKIQNLYLGYTYDLKKHCKLLDKIRLYLSINNLYTFTRYKGSDPSTINITSFDQGIDWHDDINPMARTFSFGVNLTF